MFEFLLHAGIKCTFREWGEWAVIATKYVPAKQCPSKKAQTEERRKEVTYGTCKEKREERLVCKFCPVYICACATSPHGQRVMCERIALQAQYGLLFSRLLYTCFQKIIANVNIFYTLQRSLCTQLYTLAIL